MKQSLRSIRGNLLAWQTVILVAVVVGFGSAFYLRVRYATLEQVDADLLGAAQVVATRLHQAGSARQLEIPEAYRQRFGQASADAPYLAVWDAGGRLQIASATAPADLVPGSELPAIGGTRPFLQRDRGPFREVIVRGPDDSQVLVGRQVGRERNELRRLFWWLVGTGLGVLALGLAWAWSTSRRILAPIHEMAATAERISASSLSQRIDESDVRSELGRLAHVLNQMFARLEQSFARQVRFTADASHELRTPTAVILAQSELALARDRSPQEYQEALAACYRAARRMKSLVDGLLLLARLDAGQSLQRREPVDLRQLVENSVAMLKPLADQQQVQLACSLQPALVTGDAERLSQVIVNLVHNAVTYNRPGGQVRLELSSSGDEAILAVSDTGIGIAESDLPKVLERFYRADSSASDSGGAGLGLAICHEIVRAHGGTFEVQSQLGSGTTFTLRLPE